MSIKNLEIKPSEAKAVEIASLPTRPTSSATYGGRGLTAQEMKKAYDAYPALIKERFNALIADLLSGIAINDIPFSIPSHEPFGENIEQTVKGFLDAVGAILDFGTDDARTIFGFVKQFVSDVAKATSLEYDKSTHLLSLTIDGEEKSVKIDFDQFNDEITILKDRVDLAETDISVANDEIADLKKSKLDKTGGTISGNLDVAGNLFVNGENYETTVSSLKDRVDLLSTLLFNTIITKTTVEDTYTSRVTAGGLPVVSNTPTTVHKIEGETKATENLFDLSPDETDIARAAAAGVNVSSENNTLTISGTPTGSYTALKYFSLPESFAGKTITLSQSKYFEGGSAGYKTPGAVYFLLTSNKNSYTNHGATYSTPITVTIESGYTYRLSVQIGAYAGSEIEEETISFMVNEGTTALPYSDYYTGLKIAALYGITSTGAEGETDTSFQLDYPIELRKWDYIDVDAQELVIGTEEERKEDGEAAFTEEELAAYPDGYILSANGRVIDYPMETPTTTPLECPKTYTVWRDGLETVNYGDETTLPPTITQTYYEEVTA